WGLRKSGISAKTSINGRDCGTIAAAPRKRFGLCEGVPCQGLPHVGQTLYGSADMSCQSLHRKLNGPARTPHQTTGMCYSFSLIPTVRSREETRIPCCARRNVRSSSRRQPMAQVGTCVACEVTNVRVATATAECACHVCEHCAEMFMADGACGVCGTALSADDLEEEDD